MNLWRRLFGKGHLPLEERRERHGADDVDRVSCMDIVHTIRNAVAGFRGSKGMVVVLLEGCKVQIYLFDGIPRTSWGYDNHEFSTDHVGQAFLAGPPIVLVLTIGTESLLPRVIQREFSHCDINIGNLWKLDHDAWDYEVMKALHGNDVGIRISFDILPEHDELNPVVIRHSNKDKS